MSINEKDKASPNYALFEHNTIVNTAKDIIHFSYFVNMYSKNNLFVNCIYQGDAEKSVSGWTDRVQCPDNEPYAFTKVDTINDQAWRDSVVTSLGLSHRTVEVTYNNYFQSEAVKAIPLMFDTDTTLGNVVSELSPRSKAMFDNDTEWPGLKYEKNTSVDPGFVNDPTNINDLIGHASMLYENTAGVNIHVDPDKATNPTAYQMTYEWPINFLDFKYTNKTLATGSDLGYHVGDLYHWYPQEYANWKKGIQNPGDGNSVLDNNTQNLIKVYPNPVSGDVISIGKVCNVTIYNISGQNVLSSQNSDQINISTLNAGMYFIQTAEGETSKFIRK
jgi:hypothetical protein